MPGVRPRRKDRCPACGEPVRKGAKAAGFYEEEWPGGKERGIVVLCPKCGNEFNLDEETARSLLSD